MYNVLYTYTTLDPDTLRCTMCCTSIQLLTQIHSDVQCVVHALYTNGRSNSRLADLTRHQILRLGGKAVFTLTVHKAPLRYLFCSIRIFSTCDKLTIAYAYWISF